MRAKSDVQSVLTKGLPTMTDAATMIASHRGGALEWVENSPTAFRATAALPVDQVEFDIHPSADGVIMVHHDATLDRTTTGTGALVAQSFAELRLLTLRHTAGEAIPTLDEVCAIFAPTAITLRMEVKTDAAHAPYPGLLTAALAIIDSHHMRARTVVTSFNPSIAAEAAATPGLQDTIWLVSPEVQSTQGIAAVIATAQHNGIGRLGLRSSHLDAGIVADIRAAGLGIGAWAVNDSMAIADMLALRLDVFTTDLPARALRLRSGVQPSVAQQSVSALTAVPNATAWLDAEATNEAHASAHAAITAFSEIERGGSGNAAPEQTVLRLGAWNLERCLYPAESAALLRAAGLDVALLTELDYGCHRTGQRHTTRDLADMLEMHYAYGVEFLELATMPQPIPLADTSEGNAVGFHGNGLLSRSDIRAPLIIRLDAVADWYVAPPGGQKRIGSRMAVAATLAFGTQEIVVCSVHLESNADAPGRALQFRTLLDALDIYAAERPIVIGGDLNTPVHGPDEALFDLAMARGFDWTACNTPGPTTRPSIWSKGAGDWKLDWLCTRGLTAESPAIIPAIAPDGTVLSDHDLVVVSLTLN